jgi:magnesium and cobalt transporter
VYAQRLDEFNTRFATRLAQGEIDTIGGLVMARFGHVPRRGERLDLDGLRFEVLRADSRRVILLKVTRLAPPG